MDRTAVNVDFSDRVEVLKWSNTSRPFYWLTIVQPNGPLGPNHWAQGAMPKAHLEAPGVPLMRSPLLFEFR